MVGPDHHEDIWQALMDCVHALGGAKTVGHRLRPEVHPEKAGKWLLDCLNPRRKDKLSLEQIMWILRECCSISCHAAMGYLAREAGYAEPRPIVPEEEFDEVQREVVELDRRHSALRRRVDRLASQHFEGGH